MSKKITAYIGLGSNLGDRENCIRRAVELLAENKKIQVVQTSDLIETLPLAQADQPKYLNAVAEINTTLDAEGLYKKMASIETLFGRSREEKWASRAIDLDLLLFGSKIINTANLTVPHLQMHLRSFVLNGMCQLNAEFIHPVMKAAMKELEARLGGGDFILNPDLPQLISIAGIIGVGKTTLTKKLSDLLGCEPLFEHYDTNPFMPDVYAGQKHVALDSELYFLTSRAEQLGPDALEAGKAYVSDYVLEKGPIYAKCWLDSRQMGLYENIYPYLVREITSPALIIYLQDSPQKCLERIRLRNRPYEQQIELQFPKTLESDYEQLFSDWKTCPVIRLSVSEFDCMKDSDVEYLAKQIKNYIVV